MTTSNIESYVQELSLGLESQGAGRFTLNKLPRSPALIQVSQLHPLRWAGFVLQAASFAGAVAIRLGSNAASVGVEFDLLQPAPAFLNPDLLLGEGGGSDRGARFLTQAIQWASAQDPVELHLICDGPHAGYHVVIQGEDSKTQKLPALSSRSRIALLVTFGERSPQRLLASARLEGEILGQFPHLSVPLQLESRNLALGFPPPGQEIVWCLCGPAHSHPLAVVSPSDIPFQEIQVGNGTVRRFSPAPLPVRNRLPAALAPMRRAILAGERSSDQLRFEELRTTWNSLLVKQTPKGDWTLALPYVPKIPGTSMVRCQALLANTLLSAPSQLVPVHYGMNLNPVELPKDCPPGWTVVGPAPHVLTDFSGLTAVQDDNLEALKRWAVEQIAP